MAQHGTQRNHEALRRPRPPGRVDGLKGGTGAALEDIQCKMNEMSERRNRAHEAMVKKHGTNDQTMAEAVQLTKATEAKYTELSDRTQNMEIMMKELREQQEAAAAAAAAAAATAQAQRQATARLEAAQRGFAAFASPAPEQPQGRQDMPRQSVGDRPNQEMTEPAPPRRTGAQQPQSAPAPPPGLPTAADIRHSRLGIWVGTPTPTSC